MEARYDREMDIRRLKEAVIVLAKCVDALEYPLVKDNPRVVSRLNLIERILDIKEKNDYENYKLERRI